MRPNHRVVSLRIVRSNKPINQSRINAGNTFETDQWSRGFPRFDQYMKVEAAWQALAENQDWLNGRIFPAE